MATSIGISSGIVLTTGDARFVEGPNTSDGSSGLASGLGDADLDTYFAPLVTDDTTSLEFSFRMDTPGDLFFEFVFSSEEYNEFVDSDLQRRVRVLRGRREHRPGSGHRLIP